MQNTSNKTTLEVNVHHQVCPLIFSVLLLCLPLVGTAMSEDIGKRVNEDIQLFNALETQSKTLANNQQQGVFVTIGADAACDFNSAVDSIQDAIDEGSVEVRVASNGTYQNNLILENQTVVIRGGFADCTAAINNEQVFNDLTVIDGSALAEPVIYITGSDAVQQIRLENLLLTGGTSSFPKFGGGLSVDLAAVDLQLWRVVIADNSGSAGAGMWVDASSVITHVTGREVLILNNESNSFGGGLNCTGFANIVLTGMSLIGNNMANTGGGVALRHGCSLSMYSESFDDSLSFLSGVFNNESLSNGGGAYLFNGSELYLFGQQMCSEFGCMGSSHVPVLVRDNQAGLNSGLEGNGGGLYMAQSSNPNLFYANGLIMFENSAREDGGGGYLGSNGQVTIERMVGGCWNQDRCNHIIANSSGVDANFGGAFYVANGGDLYLSQSYLEENRADFGTAISASGDAATVTLEGVVMDDNGDDGSDGFSDFSVVRADLGAAVSISHSTIVDNDLQGSVFDVGVALNSSMTLLNSIVHDPGSGDLFGPVSGTLNVSCLLAHENSSYSGSQVVVDGPHFFNRLGGDFHLNPISPAIDMCSGVSMLNPLDIDVESRGWDDPDSNNTFGTFDAGADESYVNDVIFKNNFESFIAR